MPCPLCLLLGALQSQGLAILCSFKPGSGQPPPLGGVGLARSAGARDRVGSGSPFLSLARPGSLGEGRGQPWGSPQPAGSRRSLESPASTPAFLSPACRSPGPARRLFCADSREPFQGWSRPRGSEQVPGPGWRDAAASPRTAAPWPQGSVFPGAPSVLRSPGLPAPAVPPRCPHPGSSGLVREPAAQQGPELFPGHGVPAGCSVLSGDRGVRVGFACLHNQRRASGGPAPED